MSKRQDLQGIRGIAILSVLGFHFYPNLFPNGYLGVDQFFVLSGFLMCMLLTRSKNFTNFHLIMDFYWRRFKRILPLYFLIIFICLLFLYSIFPETAIEVNQQSAQRALLFISNQPKSAEQDYFEMLSLAVDIFTHTWSLSVEVQFYFIIPIIYIFAKNFDRRKLVLYFTLIGINSFIYYSISSPNIAFNSVFSRIWQFNIGMIVYSLNSSVVYQTKHPFIYFLLGSILTIQFLPFELPSTLTRPLITIMTGLLMYINNDDNFLLSNDYLTYIGDVSYSLYLVHWPIYAYAKLTFPENQYALFICLMISIVVAMIIFETFEKWYLSIPSENVAILIILLILCNMVVLDKNQWKNSKDFESSIILKNMTIDDAEKMNKAWNYKDTQNLLAKTCKYESKSKPFGWCEHTGLKPDGKYKFMIFGNSWTANHAFMFIEECGNLSRRVVQNGAYGCEPLCVTRGDKNCMSNFKKIEERISELKPDYGFLISRFMSIGDKAKNSEKDEIYETMKKQLDIYLKHIKYKLYIVDAIPWIKHHYVAQIVPLLKNGTSITGINKVLIEYQYYEMARTRMKKLFEECGDKCIRIDYFPLFYNETQKDFQYFDERGFSYFTAINHLSPYGIEKVRPIYRDICTKLS